MIVPPLAALFAGPLIDLVSFLEFLWDISPVQEAELLNESANSKVFLELEKNYTSIVQDRRSIKQYIINLLIQ